MAMIKYHKPTDWLALPSRVRYDLCAVGLFTLMGFVAVILMQPAFMMMSGIAMLVFTAHGIVVTVLAAYRRQVSLRTVVILGVICFFVMYVGYAFFERANNDAFLGYPKMGKK